VSRDFPSLVAGHLQIRLAAVNFFGGGDRLAEFSFQLRFGESQYFSTAAAKFGG